MKYFILITTVLFSIGSQASKFESPPTCQNIKKIDKGKLCGKSIFFREHLDTYYGSTAYLAYGEKQRKAIINTIGEMKVLPGSAIAKGYKDIIESANFLIIIVDENDMPYYSIYAMGSGDTVKIMSNLSADWIIEDEDDQNNDNYIYKLFKVRPSSILESYSY